MQNAYNEFSSLDLLRKPGQTKLSQAPLCPKYWDSLPIALNLKNAYDGFPNSKYWSEGGAIINTKLLSMNKNRPIVPGCDFIMKSKGLQKFVYEQHMQCKFGLDFPIHLQARISDMFSPYLVEWENINFSASLDACKALHIGNSMKIIKTWLNGWHTSSRCQAVQPFPCLFGCHGAQDNLHHYIICPELYGLCKFLYRDLSHLPLHRFGLYNPSHELMVHICCMYGAYHTLIKYVNCHYDIYNQNFEHVLIEPRNKAWSVFAEAYDADARDFGVSTPRYSFAAWINWNINFDDPMRETASLFPEPVCNALQEFVCASGVKMEPKFVPAIELLEYGFPVSSPSGDEPSGACASSAAISSIT